MTHRSPDLLQTEEPFTLSERRSSSDSNKASSGEVSPYDNNSPVLSERRGEPGSPGSEQLFRVPEQYSLVGQVAGWSREPGAETWGSKGEPMTYVSLAFFPPKIAVCPWTVFFFFFFFFFNLCQEKPAIFGSMLVENGPHWPISYNTIHITSMSLMSGFWIWTLVCLKVSFFLPVVQKNYEDACLLMLFDFSFVCHCVCGGVWPCFAPSRRCVGGACEHLGDVAQYSETVAQWPTIRR